MMYNPNPIGHVEGLFDIVGKTVDNVEYAPPVHSDSAMAVIYFTDGSQLKIMVPTDFQWIFHVEPELCKRS